MFSRNCILAACVMLTSFFTCFFSNGQEIKTTEAPGKKLVATEHVAWIRTTPRALKMKFDDFVYESAKSEIGIRCQDRYTPTLVDPDEQPVVIFLVHGTWSQDVKSYYSVKKRFYASIREFAQTYAERHNKPVEIIPVRWSGKNNYKDRKEAALKIGALINKHFPTMEKITIAHSHGCSIINYGSSLLDKDVIIDHIINIAAPVREEIEAEYRPVHFKRLTQFYSTSDFVALAGAVRFSNFIPAIGDAHRFMAQKDRTVINVRTQINGEDTGHSGIKIVACHLTAILDKIDEHYLYNNDFVLDIYVQNPKDLAEFSKIAQEPALIAIRRNVTLADMLNHQLKNSSVLIKEHSAFSFLRGFQEEINFSNSQELAFLERYGKDFHRMDNAFYRYGRGFKLEIGKMKLGYSPLIIGGIGLGILGFICLKLGFMQTKTA
jgi:hypothetical protein